jgi:2-polyprenyl-3-methyl-5-hydroxy-6-metoxy-1,4-benzoquinol methylase
MLADRHFEEILGMDVSHRSLEIASERLRLENLAPKQKERIRLLHGSLMYKDKRLAGYDAACVMEVVEHLDPPGWLPSNASCLSTRDRSKLS